jgi:F-type H+-transporting ATPase subunit b
MDIIDILGRVGFDSKIFIFNLINFFIVAALLQKFFFKKVIATIEERQRLITEGIQNAEIAKSDLAASEQKGDEIIKQAKSKANEIVKQANDDAQVTASDVKQQAEVEAGEIKERAKKQAEQEKQKMMSEFSKEASGLVVMATEKLLNEKPQDGTDSKNINKYIESFKS